MLTGHVDSDFSKAEPSSYDARILSIAGDETQYSD